MKKSDIIDITIKIFGIYLFINVINCVKDFISILIFTNTVSDYGSMQTTDKNLLIYLSLYNLIFLTTFAIFLTFGSRIITRKVCNSSDYQDNISLFTDKKILLEMIFIITGGLIFVISLPEFLAKFISHVKVMQSDMRPKDLDTTYLILSFIKVFLGFIIIYFNKTFSGLFCKEKLKND